MVCARGPLSASEPCNAGSWRFAQDAHALGYRIKYNVVHIFKLFYTPHSCRTVEGVESCDVSRRRRDSTRDTPLCTHSHTWEMGAYRAPV